MSLKTLFFLLFIRPLAAIVLGMNLRHRNRLPEQGPAIIIANHNSHLDTVVLLSLFPLRTVAKVHPVAAEDYFLANRFLAWFSTKLIGIIPFKRKLCRENPFEEIEKALQHNEIIIFFPEGTRGEAEKLSSMKTGIAHLAKKFPNVPMIPVFLHGLGKALPKGDPLLVPFLVDVVIGEKIPFCEDRQDFMHSIEETFKNLMKEVPHLLEVPDVKNDPESREKAQLNSQIGDGRQANCCEKRG
jgi:1-acyl-sn-glycerol-3-phosphate acyltransferase